MADDPHYKEIALLNRARMAELWRRVREDPDSIAAQDQALAEQMLAHEEYHALWDNIESLAERFYDPEKEANPFLHVSMHVAIESQLGSNTPPEARQAIDRMVERGVDPHEARHTIMRLFIHEVAGMMAEQRHFDMGAYREALRQL